MADSKLSALTEVSVPELEDLLYLVEDPAGTPTSRKVSGTRLLGLVNSICQGRLTTESGVAVSTSDRTAQSTIYFTPYQGNRVALYDGTRWKLFTFTERSLALSSLTTGKNYDVFLYDNAGTLTLELSAAWTNDTTRADALATQDGVLVKSGATARRYLGTLRTTGTTTTEDSGEQAAGTTSKRFLWNYYNRVPRFARAIENADSWTYSTAAFRAANNDTTNRIEFVLGVAGDSVRAEVISMATHSVGSENGVPGIGMDSTTTNSAQIFVTSQQSADVLTSGYAIGVFAPSVGYHYLQWLEFSSAGGVTSWYGDSGVSFLQAGLAALIPG